MNREERVRDNADRQRRLIAWLRLLRQTTDRGLGDTASRLLAQASGRTVAPILARLMSSCDCRPEDAAVTLNERYPYGFDAYKLPQIR